MLTFGNERAEFWKCGLIILSLTITAHACTWGNYDDCPSWPSCSRSCGGGSRCRTCESCFWKIDKKFCQACNTFCFNGGSFQSGLCLCQPWRSGNCCEQCSPVYIAHCLPGKQECGGAPDGVRCTQCENGYMSGGYGNGCIDLNECGSYPCKNGATCTNLVNQFSCRCAPGYTGPTCASDINECASNPCTNGATCNNLVNGFTCSCAPGYTGPTCASDINECIGNRCENGATCLDVIAKYTCECAPGYDGTLCQNNINECISTPCKNNASCNDAVNKYTCTCAVGFTGINCETNIHDCEDSLCQNGGTCVDGIAKYTCMCAAGYTGTNCESNINECLSNPCKNGATCQDKVAGYKCTCLAGNTGTMCETVDSTTRSPTITIAVASSISGLAVLGAISIAVVILVRRKRANEESEERDFVQRSDAYQGVTNKSYGQHEGDEHIYEKCDTRGTSNPVSYEMDQITPYAEISCPTAKTSNHNRRNAEAIKTDTGRLQKNEIVYENLF